MLFVAGGVARLEALAGGDLEQGPRAAAIVGTRRASADGVEVARALGRGLAAAGVTVVSGMALGVDSAAHAGALESSGRTVAVLAGGADVPYPPSKARLHQRIGERGCVVGELPPGFAALRWCFPARNRIIAALAHMTIVVEAARRSGSLITAEIAADIGRDVGAVPGPVTAWRAAGTNALLRDGATVIRDAADALDVAVGVDRHEAAVLHLEPRLRALLGAVADGRDTLAALAGAPVRGRANAGGPHRARAARAPAPRGRRPLRRGPRVITNGRTSASVVAGKWYLSTMRATIDSAGRLVVPKPLRDELGFAAGTELELAAVNGALEVRVPSRVRIEDGPHGLHFVADAADELTDEQVRELIEKSRR